MSVTNIGAVAKDFLQPGTIHLVQPKVLICGARGLRARKGSKLWDPVTEGLAQSCPIEADLMPPCSAPIAAIRMSF